MKTTLAMIKDAMTYGEPIEESVSVKGYEIEFRQDSDLECPAEFDCATPSLWIGLGNGFTEYGDGALNSFFWNHVSPNWVSRHWRAICKAMDIAESEFDNDCREYQSAYGGSMSYIRQEQFAERLSDMKSDSWGYGIDYLETLRALYNLAGMYAETFQRNGYCQGDSVYGLIVMTPAWRERVGCNPETKESAHADMESQADIYGDWAFGNVWGFSIERGGIEIPDGSCYGFYGSDSEYMLLQIADEIDSDISDRKKARADKLKTLIRNRVPLALRADMIAI